MNRERIIRSTRLLMAALLHSLVDTSDSDKRLLSIAVSGLLTVFRPKMKQLPQEVLQQLKEKQPIDKLSFLLIFLAETFLLHAPDQKIEGLLRQLREPIFLLYEEVVTLANQDRAELASIDCRDDRIGENNPNEAYDC